MHAHVKTSHKHTNINSQLSITSCNWPRGVGRADHTQFNDTIHIFDVAPLSVYVAALAVVAVSVGSVVAAFRAEGGACICMCSCACACSDGADDNEDTEHRERAAAE